MSECQTKAGNNVCSLSLSFLLSHSFNLSFTHSRHAEQVLFSSLCSKVTLTLSRSHSLTLSHFHTLSMSHSITLDMLNKFCFHVYAHKSLFIAENCNGFFGTSAASREFRSHRAGSQLKNWPVLIVFPKILEKSTVLKPQKCHGPKNMAEYDTRCVSVDQACLQRLQLL